jgi:hypothetical protein
MINRAMAFDHRIFVDKIHCCNTMDYAASFKCPSHEDPFDCNDKVIYYDSRFNEYGIIHHDTGFTKNGKKVQNSSHTYEIIKYCPWCGKKLPPSRRNRWFKELRKLGFKDPMIEDIPEIFKSDAWYQTNL